MMTMALPSSAVQIRSSAARSMRLAVGLFGEHRYTSLIWGCHAARTRSGSRPQPWERSSGSSMTSAPWMRAATWYMPKVGSALQNRIAAGTQVNARQDVDGLVGAAGRQNLLRGYAVERRQALISACGCGSG